MLAAERELAGVAGADPVVSLSAGMSDSCAMLPGMHKCDCGFVLVASDDPEPMGDRLIHYIRPLLHEYLAHDLTFEEFKAIFEFSAFLWNLAATDDIPKAIRHLEQEMPPRLRIESPRSRFMVRDLLTRRRSVEFGEDSRLALQLNVYRRAGHIRVKALGVRFEPDPSHAAHEQLPPGPADEPGPKTRRVLH